MFELPKMSKINMYTFDSGQIGHVTDFPGRTWMRPLVILMMKEDLTETLLSEVVGASRCGRENP